MRPQKQTVDYFPHDAYASDGDTLTILQNYWGNDGYAFWFKLLEKLASTDGHVIDCRNPVKWQLLLAKTHIDETKGMAIMDKLAELDAIDKVLWQQHQVVWSQNFVNNIADAYKNRRRELPQKPFITNNNPLTTDNNSITTINNPQRKGKEKKGKETTTPTPSEEKNVFTLYEANFGALTPMIRDELQLLEKDYPFAWIEDAFKEAIKKEARNLKYVEAILKRWKTEGRGNGKKPIDDGILRGDEIRKFEAERGL